MEVIISYGTVRAFGPRLISFILALIILTFAGTQVAWAAAPASTPIGQGVSLSYSAAGPAAPLQSAAGNSGSATVPGGVPAGAGATPRPVDHPGTSNVLNFEQIALAAQKAGFSGHSLATAVAVAMAESSGNADVVNTSHAYGLWQVLAAAHPDLIRSADPDSSKWFDPYTNAKFAWEISDRGTNWVPWETYTTGAFQKYMGEAQAAVDSLASNPQSVTPPIAR